MGFRFYRRKKLFPGVTLNVSKSGPSVSIGGRGARMTIGPKGTRKTIGIPGTGISYTETSKTTADADSTQGRSGTWPAIIIMLFVLAIVLFFLGR